MGEDVLNLEIGVAVFLKHPLSHMSSYHTSHRKSNSRGMFPLIYLEVPKLFPQLSRSTSHWQLQHASCIFSPLLFRSLYIAFFLFLF